MHKITKLGLAFFLVPALVSTSSSCGTEPGLNTLRPSVGSTATQVDDWTSYLMNHVVEAEDGYIVEGDVTVGSIEGVRQYFDEQNRRLSLREETAVAGLEYGTTASGLSGFRYTTFNERYDYTYCVSSAFGANHGVVRDAMNAAALAWEHVARVNFRYVASADGSCTTSNPAVDFPVVVGGSGCCATAFFPHLDPPGSSGRRIAIRSGAFTQAFPDSLEGTLRHELGHVLGMMHEHQRVDAGSNCPFSTGVTNFTSYDPESVMLYRVPTNCNGANIPTAMELTPRDEQGIRAAIGAGEGHDRMLGDFNNDGKTDIALWREGWNSLPVYWGAPYGSPVSWTNSLLSDNEMNTCVECMRTMGDFDGDGSTDILLTSRSGGTQLKVYFSLNNGAFQVVNRTLPSLPYLNGSGFGSVAITNLIVGRFNNDAADDIAIWGEGLTSLVVFHGATTRGSVFQNTTSTALGASNWINDSWTNKMVGDFDADGYTDIALWREGWGSTPVYFSNGAYAWVVSNIDHVAGANWINDPASRKLLGDFNADGRTDVMLWRPGWGSNPIYSPSISVRGRFDVSNLAAPAYYNNANSIKLVLDVDGDQRDDVLVVQYDRPNDYTVRFSNGNGTFDEERLPLRQSDFVTPWPSNFVADRSVNKMIGDFDGNGSEDIAMWRAGWASTPIFYGYRSQVMVTNDTNGAFNVINTR